MQCIYALRGSQAVYGCGPTRQRLPYPQALSIEVALSRFQEERSNNILSYPLIRGDGFGVSAEGHQGGGVTEQLLRRLH